MMSRDRNGAGHRDMGRLIVVKAAYDPEAKVWFVEHCDVPGVNAEAATIEELVEKLPPVIADMLEERPSDDDGDCEVPIELIAHTRTRVRLRTAA
jgi:predicted RNase H-like HicB family nuclease